jgi:uncharacterized protein YfdQ (DUF2303 family)
MGQYDQPIKLKTEAESVADIVRQAEAPIFRESALEGDAPLVIFPRTQKIESLERFGQTPRRPRANVVVCDLPSFKAYVNRHKIEGTHIFCQASETGGSFTALIDFHVGSGLDAGWGEHQCKFVCDTTPEWKRWIEISGKGQSQTAMALFIEGNLDDILVPEPAAMLELVKSLEATQGTQFKSAVRLENGDRQLQYVHQTTAKAGQQGDMEIPTKITLRIPVFRNGTAYDVPCRFRYRISDGQLVLAIEIERPHKIIEQAMDDAAQIIEAETQINVMIGTAAVIGA